MFEKWKYKKKRQIGFIKCYKNIIFMLTIVLKYTPGYFASICLYQIYNAGQLFLEFTFTMKFLLDLITEGGTFQEALRYWAGMLLLVIFKLVWGAVLSKYLEPRAKEKLHKKLRMCLYEKAVDIDLERYDEPSYYNEFVWSINEATKCLDNILRDFGDFLSQITQIIVNGIFFVTLDILGIVFIFISLVVSLIATSYIGRKQYEKELELNPFVRKRNYFNRVFYLNDYAKEMRLSSIGDILKEEFTNNNQRIIPIINKYGKKNVIAGLIEGYLANDILLNTVYLGYLVYKTVVLKLLTYGSTMALFNASSSVKKSLRNLAVLLPKFEKHGLYIEKIRLFLSVENSMKSGKVRIKEEEFKELTVEGLSFSYKEGVETLCNINMSIKAGEKIAIVGYNGAGKSTLIKLLLRLYDIKAGVIKVNGVDIRKYNKEDYRSLFATVFQDYKIFASTIADNVKLAVAEMDDSSAIELALIESGLENCLSLLPKGIHTQLTKEFDEEGINLSGGEAQKVAIARTFYKYSPIIILDEPSSALDPMSEYNLNDIMMNAAKDKAVIFISHRLSSTVMADRIYMLEKGRIIEMGSHKELMALDGKYAKMFYMQAEKYR